MPPLQPPSVTTLLTANISDTVARVSTMLPILYYDYVGMQLVTTGTLTGTWAIEVSNNNGTDWSAITAAFSPAFTNPAGSATSQYGQCVPIVAGALRVTFTPSAGAGVARVNVCLKPSTN